MSSEWELYEGIKLIKSAWQREHTARTNLEKMLQQAETENDRLRELVSGLEYCAQGFVCNRCSLYDPSGTNHRRCESLERELGIEVDG